MTSINNELFVGIYDEAKELVKDKEINETNIIQITTCIMELVEEYPNITGEQKKKIVIMLISKLVDNSPLNDSKKNIVKTATNLILPAAIDAIVSASKSKFILNIRKKKHGCCSIV